MGRIYDIFDKFSIINIIIGFALGFYLAVHHNDASLWYVAIQFIFIFAIIMTIIPTVASLYGKFNKDEKIDFWGLVEAFILNFMMIAVCLAFGVVIGSFWIGNVIID